MDTKSWVSALVLFGQYPVLLIATFVVACAAFGAAWWLRGHIAHGEIKALKERLKGQKERVELAQEQLTAIQSKLADAVVKVAVQETEIARLRQTQPVEVAFLVKGNTEIQRALSSVVDSTSALGHTLTTTSSTLHSGTPTYYLLKSRP